MTVDVPPASAPSCPPPSQQCQSPYCPFSPSYLIFPLIPGTGELILVLPSFAFTSKDIATLCPAGPGALLGQDGVGTGPTVECVSAALLRTRCGPGSAGR